MECKLIERPRFHERGLKHKEKEPYLKHAANVPVLPEQSYLSVLGASEDATKLSDQFHPGYKSMPDWSDTSRAEFSLVAIVPYCAWIVAGIFADTVGSVVLLNMLSRRRNSRRCYLGSVSDLCSLVISHTRVLLLIAGLLHLRRVTLLLFSQERLLLTVAAFATCYWFPLHYRLLCNRFAKNGWCFIIIGNSKATRKAPSTKTSFRNRIFAEETGTRGSRILILTLRLKYCPNGIACGSSLLSRHFQNETAADIFGIFMLTNPERAAASSG